MSFSSITRAIGYLFLALIAGFLLLLLARFLFCGPDKSVEKVAFPLAKAVVEHIEKYGVPKALNEVDGLPYELSRCSNKINKYKVYGEMNIESVENCSFNHDKNNYSVMFETVSTLPSDQIVIRINIKYENTLVLYKVNYIPTDSSLGYEYFPKPVIKCYRREGLCDPKLFRLTD